MERVNRILQNQLYQSCLSRTGELEKDRIFCHHDMVHFLDVARLAMILNLTEDCKEGKERIYTAALLHDIGRFEQYEIGTPHEVASARIATEIMRECGFEEEEILLICDAIRNHRNKKVQSEKNLNGLLYRADKMSRSCFACKAETLCDWSKEKKNVTIQY